MDLLGSTIGQYQLLEIIQQGENVVYKGFQPAMNRYVAVKILSPVRSNDPAFVQQFRLDMQRVASLEHPAILPLYDYGQQDGLLYMASRYVDGGTVRDRLSQFYMLQQTQQLMQPICQALDNMHANGVVHGNLKPSNILLELQGQPLLTDFGYTQGIDVGGAASVYLSPEQTRGGPVDLRTDIYALGVLLYELVTGELPPLGAVPSPRLQRPDLPVEVEKVILRAMAQDPNQRFQSAGVFYDTLSAAIAPRTAPVAQPVAAAAPPPPAPAAATSPAPAQQPAASRGLTWILILGVVVLVCLLALVCAGIFTYANGSEDSPLYVPIFFERATDTPSPAGPTVVPPTSEPVVATATPQPEQPAVPTPEPPPEEQPEDSDGG